MSETATLCRKCGKPYTTTVCWPCTKQARAERRLVDGPPKSLPRSEVLIPGVIDRFNRSVAKGDGCWNWTGEISTKGYGNFHLRYQRIAAHIVSYLIHVGDYDRSKHICHACDNRSCVRPDHLFVGTNKENMIDCIRKGRHSNAILKAQDALEIRRLKQQGCSDKDIAQRFHVSKDAVRHVVHKRTWAHVTGE